MLAGLGTVVPTSPAAPQQRGQEVPFAASHYLYVGHWAYRYIDLMVARGLLPELQPLVQPYRRIDVAKALVAARDGNRLTAHESGWAEVVEEELQPELAALARPEPATTLNGTFPLGAWGVTSTHRDVLRPNDSSDVFGVAEADFSADFPNVALALRFRWDDWLRNDPQFPLGKVVESHPNFLGLTDFGGRAEEGYAEVQVPYLQIGAGRLYRNWGLPGVDGMLVSAYAYSYDQVFYRFGTNKLSVTGFVAQLDEYEGGIKRHYSAHRLDWRVNDNLALGFGESVVYGGENRSFDLRQATPIGVWLVGGYGEDYLEGANSNNSFSEISVWWRFQNTLVSYLSVMYDSPSENNAGPGYGLVASLQLPNLGRTALRLDYTQIGAMTYRAPIEYEGYTFRNLGLGHDKADFDQFSLTLDWQPVPRLFLTPRVDWQRAGEGDFLDPFPADGTGLPWVHTGVIEHTLRLGLRGHWRPTGLFQFEWNAGQNFFWNRDHVTDATGSTFAGHFRIAVTPRAWGTL